MDALLPLIRKEYGDKAFKLDSLLAKTGYKKSKAYALLTELIKTGALARIAGKTFKLKEAKAMLPPKEIRSLSRKLDKTFTRRFKFSSWSSCLTPVTC